MTEKPLDVDYWDSPGKEYLLYEDFDEAVEGVIDDLYPGPYPTKIEIVAFKRLTVDEKAIARLLDEDVTMFMDDNYGPEDESISMPESVDNAIKKLAEIVARDYFVYRCDEVENTRTTVDVRDWCLENRLDWLNGMEFIEEEDLEGEA